MTTAVGGIQRQAIVDALAGVDGLSPSAAVPSPIVAGSAWTVWSETVWLNNCLKQSSYFVFVALPGGAPGASVDAGDQVVDTVAAALWEVGQLSRVEPWQWPVETGQQTVPVVRFTMEVI